jgi:hypothetical protein
MLNLIQHLIKSRTYETLKQVQGDKSGLFTKPSYIIVATFVCFTLLCDRKNMLKHFFCKHIMAQNTE